MKAVFHIILTDDNVNNKKNLIAINPNLHPSSRFADIIQIRAMSSINCHNSNTDKSNQSNTLTQRETHKL